MQKRFFLVDVFTDRPFAGNQLAVFTDGSGLTGEAMQKIARELNFSETTFVLPPEMPDADWRLRIFTPLLEMPMAGHPTVGTTYVLAREGMVKTGSAVNTVRLQENVGLIPVTLEMRDGEPGMITMQQPLPQWGATLDDRAAIAEMLSISPDGIRADLPIQVVSCGVPFLYVPLVDLDTIRRVKLRPDMAERALSGVGTSYLFVFTPHAETPQGTVHSRMFALEMGIAEDPATGAASGPLGCYLVRYGLASGNPARIVSEQGFEIGRPSLLYITIGHEGGEINRVEVGGTCAFMGEGTLTIEE